MKSSRIIHHDLSIWERSLYKLWSSPEYIITKADTKEACLKFFRKIKSWKFSSNYVRCTRNKGKNEWQCQRWSRVGHDDTEIKVVSEWDDGSWYKNYHKKKKNLGTPFSNSQVFVHSFWKSSWLSIIGYIYIYCYLLWLLIYVGWKGSSRALSWLLSQIVSPFHYKCLNSLGCFCFSFSFYAPLFPIWHFAFIHIIDFRHRIDFSHSWTWLCPRLKTEWTKRNKKIHNGLQDFKIRELRYVCSCNKRKKVDTRPTKAQFHLKVSTKKNWWEKLFRRLELQMPNLRWSLRTLFSLQDQPENKELESASNYAPGGH